MLSRRDRSMSPLKNYNTEGVSVIENSKGRKKFSFKEPEIMAGFLGFRNSFMRRSSHPQNHRSKSQPPPRETNNNKSNGKIRSRELEELEVRRFALRIYKI